MPGAKYMRVEIQKNRRCRVSLPSLVMFRDCAAPEHELQAVGSHRLILSK